VRWNTSLGYSLLIFTITHQVGPSRVVEVLQVPKKMTIRKLTAFFHNHNLDDKHLRQDESRYEDVKIVRKLAWIFCSMM
jgi:hypothetical protein